MASNPERFRHLQTSLAAGQAILLSTPTDLAYFADFSVLLPEEREGFLLITAETCYLIKATFSPAPAEHTYQILEQCRPPALAKHLEKIIQADHLHELALDFSSVFVDEYQAIQKVAEENQVTLVAEDKDQIWQLRMIKDETEIEELRLAGHYGEAAFQTVRKKLQVGITEKEVAAQIEVALLELGADKTAFPTIVAFGANGASPHYQPGNVALTAEMPVLIDMGAMVHGYRSDLTRSFWFGDHPTEEFTKIEKIVIGAYQETAQFLDKTLRKSSLSNLPGTVTSIGIAAKELDTIARTSIRQYGYGQQFIHTTGHGVGLDIHEPPSLNWSNDQPLKPGMVITIEPGIYLPDHFGLRYENTILIGEKHSEVLTK